MKRIGTQIRLTDDERAHLEGELNFWRNKANEYYANRDRLERAFYCIWEGQSASGLVEDSENEKAWPFDGASDRRVRWGDKIYTDFASLIMTALAACQVQVTCSAGPDSEQRAAAIARLLKWEIQKVGAAGMGQMMALIHYFLVDSPAVGAMSVAWRKRTTLGVGETTRDELEEEFSAAMVAADEMSEMDAAGYFASVMMGEGDPERLIQYLVTNRGVRMVDAPKIVKALAEDGEVEFLRRVDVQEGPELKALRYGDDFCIPGRCEDFDYASPWFRGEWVTQQRLRERVAEDGWDSEWVEETIAHAGSEFYNELAQGVADDDLKDMCNICWCYQAETNDAGETVRYVSVISHANGSAFGKRVLRSRRGKWNTVFFRREVVSGAILESRGLAEICAPDQGVAKSVKDGEVNNALVGSLPPVKAKGTRVKNALLEPFGVVNMGTNDDVAFMQPPAYPAAAKEVGEDIKAELLAYVGVSDGKTDVSERRRAFVGWMLQQFRELYVTMVEVAQDNASDEALAGITGEGDTKGLKREDVTGDFGITLELDPDNLNDEKLIKKIQTFGQVLLSMDRNNEVDTGPMVRHAMTLMFPELASTSFKSAEQLGADETEDEQRNFVLIKSGVMPRMDTEGKWNYQARLAFWQQLQQENPDAIAEMSPRSQEMMNQWISALEQQNTQYGANREIGRTGVEGVSAQ